MTIKKRHLGTGLAIAGIWSLLGVTAMTAGPDTASSTKQIDAATEKALESANISAVRKFFDPNTPAREKYDLIHPDYIQHNPVFRRVSAINGVKGREEYDLVQWAAKNRGPEDEPLFPPPDPNAPEGDRFHMVVADGDLVTLIETRYSPDPMNPGQYYEHYWFDTWRLKDGKLYEHWDPQTIPEKIPDFLRDPLKK